MNGKKLTIGTLIIALVALTTAIFSGGGEPTVQQITKVIKESSVGAGTGPVNPFNYSVDGGVQQLYFSSDFSTASTSLCSYAIVATSTLTHASASVTSASTTATYYEWGKALGPAATTTSLGKYPLASFTKGTLIASTTVSSFAGGGTGVDPAFVFSPGTHLVLKVGGAAGDTNVLAGSCKAVFLVN